MLKFKKKEVEPRLYSVGVMYQIPPRTINVICQTIAYSEFNAFEFCKDDALEVIKKQFPDLKIDRGKLVITTSVNTNLQELIESFEKREAKVKELVEHFDKEETIEDKVKNKKNEFMQSIIDSKDVKVFEQYKELLTPEEIKLIEDKLKES